MTAQFISQPRRQRNSLVALFAVVFVSATLALAMVISVIWLVRLMTPLPEQTMEPTPALFPAFESPVAPETTAPAQDTPTGAKVRPVRAYPLKARPEPEAAIPHDPFAGVEVVPTEELAAISQARQ